MNQYPELQKQHKIIEKAQSCGAFLDSVLSDGRVLCERHTHTDDCWSIDGQYGICGYTDDSYIPVHVNIEKLLAKFFDIDTNKIEQEKEQMLDEMRRINES